MQLAEVKKKFSSKKCFKQTTLGSHDLLPTDGERQLHQTQSRTFLNEFILLVIWQKKNTDTKKCQISDLII